MFASCNPTNPLLNPPTQNFLFTWWEKKQEAQRATYLAPEYKVPLRSFRLHPSVHGENVEI